MTSMTLTRKIKDVGWHCCVLVKFLLDFPKMCTTSGRTRIRSKTKPVHSTIQTRQDSTNFFSSDYRIQNFACKIGLFDMWTRMNSSNSMGSPSTNSKKFLDFCFFATSLWLFICEEWCNVMQHLQKVISKKYKEKNLFFVGTLKVWRKKQIWSRIC